MAENELIQPIEPYSGDDEGQQHITIKTGKATNLLAKTNSKKQGISTTPIQAMYGSAAQLQRVIDTGQLRLAFEGEEPIQIDPRTNKCFVWLNHLATNTDYDYTPNTTCTVHTCLTEMMDLWGLKSRKDARKRFKGELDTIRRISMMLEDDTGLAFAWIPLAGGTCGMARNGDIIFTFSAEFMRNVLSRKAAITSIDPAIFSTDDKNNPHAFSIGMRLYEHSNMNIRKKNENTLGVSSLLAHLTALPTAEEIAQKDRGNETARIIAPVERDLNHLRDIGILAFWDYCHSNGEPLTDEEQAARLDANGNEKPIRYDLAVNLNITWEFANRDLKHEATRIAFKEERRLEAAQAAEEEAKREERRKRAEDKTIGEQRAKKTLKKQAHDDAEQARKMAEPVEEEPLHFD